MAVDERIAVDEQFPRIDDDAGDDAGAESTSSGRSRTLLLAAVFEASTGVLAGPAVELVAIGDRTNCSTPGLIRRTDRRLPPASRV